MNQIMDRMIVDAETKALPVIETFALGKNLAECDKAIDLISTKYDSVVSEYYPWFEKIHQYLKNHPEEVTRIEKFAKTYGLTEFFKMK